MTLFEPFPEPPPDEIAAARRRREAQARAERDDALRRVDAHGDPNWKIAAYDFLHAYLIAHDTMFVDDLWAAGLPPAPGDDRVLGSIFQKAARAGWMEKSGTYRPSVRSHMTEKAVWRSLICET